MDAPIAQLSFLIAPGAHRAPTFVLSARTLVSHQLAATALCKRIPRLASGWHLLLDCGCCVRFRSIPLAEGLWRSFLSDGGRGSLHGHALSPGRRLRARFAVRTLGFCLDAFNPFLYQPDR